VAAKGAPHNTYIPSPTPRKKQPNTKTKMTLTKHQLRLLHMKVRRLSNSDIAAELGITEATVRKIFTFTFAKLGLSFHSTDDRDGRMLLIEKALSDYLEKNKDTTA
jgi:DNA-binding NarL/FixJ family response regulator